jgi:hypothetical protein
MPLRTRLRQMLYALLAARFIELQRPVTGHARVSRNDRAA